MSTKLLLPNRYKKIGWFILLPATILGLVLRYYDFNQAWLWVKVFAIVSDGTTLNSQYFTYTNTNIANTVIGGCFIIGAMMVAFSKEKNEDEYIAELRLSSLLWAVFVSYVLLFFSFVFVYGTRFLDVMIFNMFTILFIFIVRFNYILYRNTKTVTVEK